MSSTTLPRGWKIAIGVLVFLAACLGGLGAILSFHAVSAVAAAHDIDPEWAGAVPIILDIGIAVAVGANLVLIRLGHPIHWVPWFADALAVGTVLANVDGQTTPTGIVVHAAPVAVWIAVTHGAAAVVRVAVEGPRVRPDRIPVARWACAPVPTLLLWRRMKMWGEPSYTKALGREKTRLLAQCQLRKDHGLLWRWKADRSKLVLHRMNQLVPSNPPAPTVGPVDVEPATEPAKAVRRPAPRRSQSTGTKPAALSHDELELRAKRAREICEAWLAENGRWPSAGTLISKLSGFDIKCGAGTANKLIDQFKTEETQ